MVSGRGELEPQKLYAKSATALGGDLVKELNADTAEADFLSTSCAI